MKDLYNYIYFDPCMTDEEKKERIIATFKKDYDKYIKKGYQIEITLIKELYEQVTPNEWEQIEKECNIKIVGIKERV